ncbi:flagellar hook-length control protein FliK [Campylobacter pinnipediorum subsp. pinnipediorum]|uniref:flagellar hook-length control protein FliK n=1 Tax=Campylobacter pinnipediorum TaxID=1965231 RepID=UPI000995455A|nr:flagellar hook-length control protein FliK [Campylobacter pinnipediorum]OPA79735.1 flagellar hook-length control protein FliK [Campylobacter pinnipediorum subsp. pinnipediorum]
MADITTNIQNSINQTGLNTNVKQTGQIFKKQPQPNTKDTIARDKLDLENVDKFINKVMNELSGAKTKNQTNKILQMVKDTKIAPNLANDIQNVAKLIENDESIQNNPALKDLALKLKEFLKPIADIKTATLNEQIKNSGVMLEGNLKEALNPQKLPSSINKLLFDIKNLSNNDLLDKILTLSKNENLNDNDSFLKLKEILKNEETALLKTLNNSNIKGLLTDINKLDNISKFLSKFQINIENSGDKVKLYVDKLQDFVSKLDNKINSLNTNEKLNQISGFSSNFKDLKIALKDIQNTLKSLNNIGDEINLVKSFDDLLDGSNSNLQFKLQSAARRLSTSLTFIDNNASDASNKLKEIKHISNQLKIASNDIINIEKNNIDVAKIISSDIKSTLLSIQEKSAGLNNSSQINQISEKMLSQIEIHQMVSSIGGGIQTYLPYIWDGVDGGSIAFKQGKRDRYYAQIDLNFKQYGKVNIMVGLIDKKYIDISIATAQKSLKDIIFNEAKELKISISKLGLIVSNFNLKVLSKNEIAAKFKDFSGLEFGFDKKA